MSDFKENGADITRNAGMRGDFSSVSMRRKKRQATTPLQYREIVATCVGAK